MRLYLRPALFLPGDRLEDGAIVSPDGITFVRGGVRVGVFLPDGTLTSRHLNGRYKFFVDRVERPITDVTTGDRL